MQSKLLRYLPLLYLAALLPVMILRDFTPSNELRYLSIADEAIANGNLFTFSNQGVPYADKPPLYIWIVMLGRTLFGEHVMWFLALFSFVPALVTLRTMNCWVADLMTTSERATATLMLMSCGLFLGLAIFLRMDMLMNMFITLALYTFYQIYSSKADTTRNRTLFGFWLFMALFTKGPVGILVPLVSTVTFLICKRQWRTIGRYWGWRTWTILLVGCAAWWGGVLAEGGVDYLHNLLFHQTIDRAVDAFHHKEPSYYYLISMWYSMAPWSPLAVVATVVGVAKGLLKSDVEQLFATIILTTLVMLSAFSSKIAVYLSPIFPFAIYLGALISIRMGRTLCFTLCIALPAAIFILALPALTVVARQPDLAWLDNVWLYGAGAILSLAGIGALFALLHHRNTLQPAIRTLSAGLLAALFVGGFSLRQLNVELGYGSLCHKALDVAKQHNMSSNFYVWRLHRPENMDVYLGCDIKKVTTDEILTGQCKDGVLMLPTHRLRKDPHLKGAISSHRCDTVGRYLVVTL